MNRYIVSLINQNLEIYTDTSDVYKTSVMHIAYLYKKGPDHLFLLQKKIKKV